MKTKLYFRPISIFLMLPLMFMLTMLQQTYANEGRNNLAGTIAALKLGMDGYTIGTKLSDEKKAYSASSRIEDAYPGTYKFSDNGLLIVVAQKDDTVLAIYQRHEKAGIDQVRKMISGLMGLFGEPTTMAHDKLVYWAYGEQGKIPEDKYIQLREKGEKISVLATVKLSSSLTITSEDQETEETGTTYFIISSDPLIQDFMHK